VLLFKKVRKTLHSRESMKPNTSITDIHLKTEMMDHFLIPS